MVRYKRIIEQYFQELKDFYTFNNSAGLATAELSYRPYLDKFFSDLNIYINPTIQKIFEPRLQGKFGRPDWAFSDSQTMGIYGYVEAKGLSPMDSINDNEYKAQVSKYLKLGNPVLLTDGIEFIYYTVDGSIYRFSLFTKPVNWVNPEYNLDSLRYFREFFSKIGFQAVTEQTIISELSKRAQLLCEDLTELLNLDEDEAESESELNTIRTLKRLWDNASNNLDKSLSTDKTFAGFISQILAFGLLYAHRFVNDEIILPSQKYETLHCFWTHRMYEKYSTLIEPFVHLFNALSEELNSKLSKIGGWYDNTRRYLSFVKLSKKATEKPNFHQLYELFLTTYDKGTRTDFGAWYTPLFLANFITRLVQFNIQVNPILQHYQYNPFVLIDPCCGTGTFLEAALENIEIPEKSTLTGFEILPVPYALANYRLSLYELLGSISISVHLTNTLGDNTFSKPNYDLKELDSVGLFFAKEQIASYTLSQPPLTIIIGNPPCSDSSVTNSGKILNKLMNDFRPPIKKGRQNTQMQLSNEWIKFLRWGLYKAIESKPSVVAFILPSTFAENITFKYARKYLIEHSSELSVIEFDSDNRVESENQNVFNTLQGRLIILASFTDDLASSYVRYKDISTLSRSEKIKFFSCPITSLDWRIVTIDSNFSLRPKEQYDIDLYSKFVPLTLDHDSKSGIFLRHCSGLKLAPTHLLVHFSKGQLSRRCKYIGDTNHSYEEIKNRWYKGQVKPPSSKKLTPSVRNILANTYKQNKKYSYRPFLEAFVNDDEVLLSELRKTEGAGMRDRPEVRAAFSDTAVFGFSIAPAPAEISRGVDKFCSFCWNLPDNDLVTRGSARVYCNMFPDYKGKNNWSKKAICNINPTLIEKVKLILDEDSDTIQDSIVYYTYAILTSPYFLNTFSAKLHSATGQMPSIPFTANKELFKSVVSIGRRLASLESNDYQFSKSELDSNDYFQWTNTIPTFELKSYSVKTDSIEISTTDGKSIVLPLPPDILSFTVSGYNIIREWLKYHSYSYYRKSLMKEELDCFLRLINRIRLYLMEYADLDSDVQEILTTELIQI